MANIRIEGIDEVLAEFEDLAEAKEMVQTVAKACALVERSAKQKAPKGTSELRRSITSRVERDGEDIIGIVYTPLEYAPYVEFGTGLFADNGGRTDVPWCYQDDEGNWHTTSGQHPQPFLYPALDENREKILRLLGEGMTSD